MNAHTWASLAYTSMVDTLVASGHMTEEQRTSAIFDTLADSAPVTELDPYVEPPSIPAGLTIPVYRSRRADTCRRHFSSPWRRQGWRAEA